MILELQTLLYNQWHLVEKILRLLQPIEEVIKRFSSTSISISEVIVEVQVLLRYLGKKENDEGVQTMRNELRKSIEARFVIDGKIFTKKHYIIAKIFDSRFKTSFFTIQQKDYLGTIKDMLISEMEKDVGPEAGLPTNIRDNLITDINGCESPPAKKSLREEIHDSIKKCYDEILSGALDYEKEISYSEDEQMSFSPRVSQNIQENHFKFQLECYLEDPLLPRSKDPLLWWKRNDTIYSNLVPVAVKYLSAPPSSIYSERLFSTAGIIFEERRSSLLPENGERLIFIQKNLSLFNYKY
ncbi:Zinc finger BED domain-containing protein 4 [Oopsacas minuta]|uniref:Zinc finger BED domain-containing protein 4 n=1 Tax=Oopsacas minuta TaxID=111878 RepID=A0AAV7JFU3_9METZ|nr:Zinc finger BED domain-containing protein 4 [Oopsacas minuta]